MPRNTAFGSLCFENVLLANNLEIDENGIDKGKNNGEGAVKFGENTIINLRLLLK